MLAESVVTAIALEEPSEILICCASRTGCVPVFTKGSSGSYDTSAAFVLRSRSGKTASSATDFECSCLLLRSLRKIPLMKRSMKNASTSKLTTSLGAIPNQPRVARS